jgi:threonine aldolase
VLANGFGSIYCHESSHIEIHEAGAPEFYTGAKLVLLKGHDYKIAASALDSALQNAGIGETSRVLPFAVSVTQPTDYGTVYTIEELSAIVAGRGEASRSSAPGIASFATRLTGDHTPRE